MRSLVRKGYLACQRCDAIVKRKSGRQIYCKPCAVIRATKERSRPPRMTLTEKPCQYPGCSNTFEQAANARKYCNRCSTRARSDNSSSYLKRRKQASDAVLAAEQPLSEYQIRLYEKREFLKAIADAYHERLDK